MELVVVQVKLLVIQGVVTLQGLEIHLVPQHTTDTAEPSDEL